MNARRNVCGGMSRQLSPMPQAPSYKCHWRLVRQCPMRALAAALVLSLALAGSARAERPWRGTVGGLKDRGASPSLETEQPYSAPAPSPAPSPAREAFPMRRSAPSIDRPSSLSEKRESPKLERRSVTEIRPSDPAPVVRDSAPVVRDREPVIRSSRSSSGEAPRPVRSSIFGGARADKSRDAGDAPRSITIGHSKERSSSGGIFSSRADAGPAADPAPRERLITPKPGEAAGLPVKDRSSAASTANSGAVSVWRQGRSTDVADARPSATPEKGLFSHSKSRESRADKPVALPGSGGPVDRPVVDNGSIRLPGSDIASRDDRADVKRDFDRLRGKVDDMRASRSSGPAVAKADAPSALAARSWSGGPAIGSGSVGARGSAASRITRPLPRVSPLASIGHARNDSSRRRDCVPSSAFFRYRRPAVIYRPVYYCPPVYTYPIHYEPVICHPVFARPWWAYGCPTWRWPYNGFSFGYHGKHWSIWFSDVWPSAHYSTTTVYVEQPVYYTNTVYEAAPVRYVDAYDHVDRLIDQLKYGDVETRKTAAEDLGLSRTFRALYPLVYALEYDQEPIVRYHAARALGRLGFRDALAALRRSAAEDPEEVVRIQSADSIDRILEG